MFAAAGNAPMVNHATIFTLDKEQFIIFTEEMIFQMLDGEENER